MKRTKLVVHGGLTLASDDWIALPEDPGKTETGNIT